MPAHCSYVVFTTRADEPPATLLADAAVPALDPALWTLSSRDVDSADPLVEVLRLLAFERQPPIPRRYYPTPHLYRQALVLEVGRDDSLYPDAIAFATGAVAALVAWADGPVVDLTAERCWTRREWTKRVAAKRFRAAQHISVHTDFAEGGRTASLHTHGMTKFAHRDFAALDVPDEGLRAVAQLLGHLAAVRALTLEPLEPGHAFDPGFGQPMVAFTEAPEGHPVREHVGAAPSVVVDFDVDTGEAVEGLYELLREAKALDRAVPDDRHRWRILDAAG